eukprot:GHVH01005612.1.p1 GENE.GHVH01005612.1~~GHVH01005612.1.p1  ORF type:complete len:812 (-),score=80.67 GHVH01005612.1:207-2642(-)
MPSLMTHHLHRGVEVEPIFFNNNLIHNVVQCEPSLLSTFLCLSKNTRSVVVPYLLGLNGVHLEVEGQQTAWEKLISQKVLLYLWRRKLFLASRVLEKPKRFTMSNVIGFRSQHLGSSSSGPFDSSPRPLGYMIICSLLAIRQGFSSVDEEASSLLPSAVRHYHDKKQPVMAFLSEPSSRTVHISLPSVHAVDSHRILSMLQMLLDVCSSSKSDEAVNQDEFHSFVNLLHPIPLEYVPMTMTKLFIPTEVKLEINFQKIVFVDEYVVVPCSDGASTWMYAWFNNGNEWILDDNYRIEDIPQKTFHLDSIANTRSVVNLRSIINETTRSPKMICCDLVSSGKANGNFLHKYLDYLMEEGLIHENDIQSIVADPKLLSYKLKLKLKSLDFEFYRIMQMTPNPGRLSSSHQYHIMADRHGLIVATVDDGTVVMCGLFHDGVDELTAGGNGVMMIRSGCKIYFVRLPSQNRGDAESCALRCDSIDDESAMFVSFTFDPVLPLRFCCYPSKTKPIAQYLVSIPGNCHYILRAIIVMENLIRLVDVVDIHKRNRMRCQPGYVIGSHSVAKNDKIYRHSLSFPIMLLSYQSNLVVCFDVQSRNQLFKFNASDRYPETKDECLKLSFKLDSDVSQELGRVWESLNCDAIKVIHTPRPRSPLTAETDAAVDPSRSLLSKYLYSSDGPFQMELSDSDKTNLGYVLNDLWDIYSEYRLHCKELGLEPSIKADSQSFSDFPSLSNEDESSAPPNNVDPIPSSITPNRWREKTWSEPSVPEKTDHQLVNRRRLEKFENLISAVMVENYHHIAEHLVKALSQIING